MELNKGSDLAYFVDMFEKGRPGSDKTVHTPQMWDERAESWGRELSVDCPFRRTIDDRVRAAVEYLTGRGLLNKDSRAIDIGCGPGRYVVEFARCADHASGIDISEKMLELAAGYAKEQGVNNVTFTPCDFSKADISEMGWEGAFDLVFSSITPAINSMEGLEKSMKMSRGYCFHSNFLYWNDELENQIGQAVFGAGQRPHQKWDWHWHYSLFNILFLKGYNPESHYHKQKIEDKGEVNIDLARYYAGIFTKDRAELEVNAERVFSYLKSMADENGMVDQNSERWYAWLLWDVRGKVEERG
ncbi:MAG: class I SAM-dependent methyltransferase [Lacrimispora sp.]|uniref:class I SAM-dependent methyltransferase n=1 Tax=Lacrimispora sp. TaxID=2719234 RepID=UPI0039E5D1D1